MAQVKTGILDRYARTEEGRVVIDVSAPRVEDLYADFDKKAPYHRKDLDDDLVEYLAGCVQEIGRADFVIRFAFDQQPEDVLMEEVRSGVNFFFIYQRELELAAIRKMLQVSFMLLLSGLVMLAASLWLPGQFEIPDAGAAPSRILVEGLTIAAWVAIWEALVRFLMDWTPKIRRARRFRRIASAPVVFTPARDPVDIAATSRSQR
ncbi:MAG: hypothetical protein A3K90_01755 [Pelodictyon luteolum]|uniref:Uncharacterized protein n=1 Tax=Pelodictyon luteolum TaxID=1100 RepID=A0A165L253_PELLU|nr:hypothetical protein [Pelodictyon luteolum]KZK73479.1 MAG: hypothetical protein A3K90_01755 [Pelodictyon luteolum]